MDKKYLLQVDSDLWTKLKVKTAKDNITIKQKLIDLIKNYAS
jgi:hypothetical protein|tara:strand:+ start:469 stop:594 length:126 start_codon:yes stop_codon:yes gene_type:complete